MNPFKRTARAAAKRRAGRHRRPEPEPEPLRGGAYPLMRTPVAQVLLNPHQPSAEVPAELAEQDYEFPPVRLPASRPLVDHTQLLAALEGDDTQPIEPVTETMHFSNDFVLPVCEPGFGVHVATPDEKQVTCAQCLNWLEHQQPSVLDGLVLDDTPQPAQHAGLAPVPVPSLPFLNAHAPHPQPEPEPRAPWLHVGNALPARLTAPELMLLGRPIPDDTPPAVRTAALPATPAPVARDEQHPLLFGCFDNAFWAQVEQDAHRIAAPVIRLIRENNQAAAELSAHMARVDAAHKAAIVRVAAHEYAGRLADASRPLPRRTPGVALTAIEASRRQLVAS